MVCPSGTVEVDPSRRGEAIPGKYKEIASGIGRGKTRKGFCGRGQCGDGGRISGSAGGQDNRQGKSGADGKQPFYMKAAFFLIPTDSQDPENFSRSRSICLR